MKQNKRLLIIELISAMLLLVPLIAMQFSEEVNWTFSDFAIAGFLLFGTGLMCELAMRKINKPKYQIASCIALLAFLLFTWAELAVGFL